MKSGSAGIAGNTSAGERGLIMKTSGRQAVVTGLGVVTSIGSGEETFFQHLLEGSTGLKPVTVFDTSGHTNKLACQIDEIPLSLYNREEIRASGRATRILVPAIEQALRNAGLEHEASAGCRIGLCVGTTMGDIDPLENALHGQSSRAFGGPHEITGQIQRMMRLQGPAWTFTNACAAGNFAIARAVDEIAAGRADIMIACGVDSLSWVAFTGFSTLRAMAPDKCRPFDAARKGLILGEGAGVLVIESLEHAILRKVRPRARLLGYGMSCDAHHITQPDPEGRGAARAMEAALRMAGLAPCAVDYVSLHGTGTMANDRMEARAQEAVFSEGSLPPASSIKGHLGHTLGAASAIEAVMSVKCLETGIAPMTLNLEQVDPECSIPVIRGQSKPGKYRTILSNSYAFGGVNSSILLGACTSG
ncbi:beta-ketoacyl synthase [Paenibacillus sp. FJAT-26967]|uniref:beta-ketoacyl-[acyl-carrier-protein] synthase family protein n=1 Tax=Paenibacillus sp. FJAT-26967 TaxID=1729690 RepID=UPI000ADFF0D1|nr:beta-ketoacyl-[acyl-carrier-protein] synthase family protein [Paenibacillus sp. FJAT-26967]